jgi:hypothetical protein
VLDISFNNIYDLSQLNNLSSFPRLKILHLNDNFVSDQKKHIQKVMEVVPWLIELDNEPVKTLYQENATKEIFHKFMAVVGMQHLRERSARGDTPFLRYKNPMEVEQLWTDKCVKSNDTHDSFMSQSKHVDIQQDNTCNIMDKEYGTSGSLQILWATIVELHYIMSTHFLLRTRTISKGRCDSNFVLLPHPCTCVVETTQRSLAFQEMLETQKKLISMYSKSLSSRHEPSSFESTSHGAQESEKESLSLKLKANEPTNNDQCFKDHLNYACDSYVDVFEYCMEYKLEILGHIKRIRLIQSLARGTLARKKYKSMQELKKKERIRQSSLKIAAQRIQASSL